MKLDLHPSCTLKRIERPDGFELAVDARVRWPKTGVRLTVSFMDTWPTALRDKVMSHLNAWSLHANVRFEETSGVGQVRIARVTDAEWPDMGGYWSYLGKEILEIQDDEPTMNLEAFTEATEDSEFHRVVRHEAGHTLGFPHEHMRQELVQRLDPAKVIAYYARTQGWSPYEVRQQVLTPLGPDTILGTPPDETSIMCYQIPGALTKDGLPIEGGLDINTTDHAFAAKLYPKPA